MQLRTLRKRRITRECTACLDFPRARTSLAPARARAVITSCRDISSRTMKVPSVVCWPGSTACCSWRPCTGRYSAALALEANSTASHRLTGAPQRTKRGRRVMSRRPRTSTPRAGWLRQGVRLLLACLVAMIPLGPSSAAFAAVQYCMPWVKADPAEGSSMTKAKRLALANWLTHAATFGVEYTRWGISWNHELACKISDSGTIICEAAGHPCAVRQVPPDNFIPLRPGIIRAVINSQSQARQVRLDQRPVVGNVK